MTMTQLVEEWRKQGDIWIRSEDRDENVAAAAIQVCSDELEALLKSDVV